MSFRNAWYRTETTVACLACGESVERSAAREYDKHGNRWNRDDKRFEYLCKPCDTDRCHSPRNSLESDLVAAGAGRQDDAAFFAAYFDVVADDRPVARDE